MRIYLGGAIDLADPKAHSLFEEVSTALVSALHGNAVIFNPFKAFVNANKTVEATHDSYVTAINHLALIESDWAVFIWSNAQSFGVPIEIDRRVQEKKPLIVINLSGKAPGIYMRSAVIHSGLGHIYNSIEEMVNAITKHSFGAQDGSIPFSMLPYRSLERLT